MTLLKDLIDIPERVHKGDFVLRLTEGIAHGDTTLRDYVVTEQLVRCFNQALSLIRGAVETGSSKGAYLHGSFGSGKSHFMAVLHMLLHHDPGARKVPELAPVVAGNSAWMEGKRFLLVPYHMIGAHSMESALFEGYVSTVRALHPDAPLPAVYRSERLFDDAARIRGNMGDAAFFSMLNQRGAAEAEPARAGGGGGWGKLGKSWDAARFDQAVASDPGTELRRRLEQDLVARIFASYGDVTGEAAYVDIDPGLAELSRHAHDLGYHGLILFLDELILWLASHVAEMKFVTREVQKIPKLVEARSADRPCPIVSFVARQRDLKELVGEHIPGAEQLGFTDLLNYWRDRFDTITLEDRNLPAIVEKRLLRPVNESARGQIDVAFQETEKAREAVLDVLLTRDGDRKMFRAVYPFSPALVRVLVAVSSALQRERTALRVMLQLLVTQRSRLELGQVIPVGDLFDVIAEGDEPFSDVMRQQFENAKKLYWNKIVPMLVDQYGLSRYEALEELEESDPKVRAFRADDRLVKTLLLSALVPEEESLKALTPERLQALNHGSIRTPIPGKEASEVLRRARHWAGRVGEIKIGEGENPVLSVQLTGVDVEQILERAAHADNRPERLRKIRSTLFRQLEVAEGDLLGSGYEWRWRGTKRHADVMFGNIREHADETLRAQGDHWKVFFDYPFDDPGFSPRHDFQKVEAFRDGNPPTRTVCWIPRFFSRETLSDLKTLVILDYVLAGERLANYADHLTQIDRQQARILLDNQRSQLQQKLIETLEAAYGIATAQPRALDEEFESTEFLSSLDPAFRPRSPVGSHLKAAFEALLDQMLRHQFPAHPEFEREIKDSELAKIREVLQAAAADKDGRTVPEKPLRPLMRQIAMPLQLGEQHEAAFLLKDDWKNRFLQASAGDGGPITVGKLRGFIDQPKPRGLPREVQNLLILTFADQTGKRFQGAGAESASLTGLDDAWELCDQRLPSEEEWVVAQDRANRVFGIVSSKLRNAHNVADLERQILERCAELRAVVSELPRALRDRRKHFESDDDASRQATADEALALLDGIRARPDDSLFALARADLKCPAESLARSMKSAPSVLKALRDPQWDLIDGLLQIQDERRAEAEAIRTAVVQALRDDEYVTDLGLATKKAWSKAIALLAKAQPVVSPRPAVSPPQSITKPGWRVASTGEKQGVNAAAAEDVFSALRRELERPGRTIDLQWTIREKSDGADA